MRSGLLITIWIYPVKQITQQTHRCVVSYDRAEIVNSRRKAGLATNLGELGVGETGSPASLAVAIAPAPVQEILKAAPTVKAPASIPAKPQTADRSSDLKPATKKMLDQALTDPKRFGKWSNELHGLSVSARAVDLDEQSRIALIAVRNNGREAVRILPDNPQLFVETLDEKGKPLQVSPIKILHSESAAKSSVINPGAIVYYAVAYQPPILGAKQRLGVAVGQTNAADEPVSISLSKQ
jgi:hypothetical protein